MTRAIPVSACILVFLFSAFSLAMGQAEESLVGYWPFDEGSGKKAKDASGNGYDGNLKKLRRSGLMGFGGHYKNHS